MAEEIQEAKRLIEIDFTCEDFYTEKPYAYLYEHKDNAFLLQVMVTKMRDIAKSVGYKTFLQTWNKYLESHKQRGGVIGGQNDTNFPDQPMQLFSGGYTCDENGVKRYSEMLGDVVVISHPIMPVKRVINLDDGFERMELAYMRGTRSGWRQLTVPKETISSSQKITALSKMGVGVTSENAKELVKYLSELESLNYDALPVQSSTSHMGWLPDGRFAPYAEDIAYDGESPEFARMYKDFDATGSEKTWMDIAKQTRKGESIPARIALAASFASPLISLFGALPFFVHLWGTQGCGKTVGLMLAASVWGNPAVPGYIKTFGGTKVSHEIYAAFCGNMPIFLDELQVISDRKSFDDIIYMLCEGASKGRGSKDGGLQLQRRWSACILTTGEMPIVQSNSGGGATVRTIEVNYGGQPLFDDARSVAQTLKENYGWAGRKFINYLRKPDCMETLRIFQKQFYDELNSADIQGKQVLSASILLTADALATACIFKDNRALTVDDIKPYLITEEEADINKRCYDWLMSYIGSNPRRFDPKDENSGEFWGEIKDGYVYILRNIFERIVKNEGFSAGAFLTWAKRKGKLKTESAGLRDNRRMTIRRGFGRGPEPCYAIMLDETDEDQQQSNRNFTPSAVNSGSMASYAEVDDDDMPF